jgi:hypothetical protein
VFWPAFSPAENTFQGFRDWRADRQRQKGHYRWLFAGETARQAHLDPMIGGFFGFPASL